MLNIFGILTSQHRYACKILCVNPPPGLPLSRLGKREKCRDVGYEDERLLEIALNCVQCWVLILSALNMRILLPEC